MDRMAHRVRTVLTAGLTLLLVSAGCIGHLTEPIAEPSIASETSPSDTGAPLADAHSDPSTRTLRLVVELARPSATDVRILDVSAQPIPADRVRFLANPGHVLEDDRRHAMILEMPVHGLVTPIDLQLTVTDGRGQAMVSLTIGPWPAHRDATQVLELRVPEPGTVDVLGLSGPLDGTVHTDPAVRGYGMLVEPDGETRVLEDFPYRVHVPKGFPSDVPEGGEITFWIEDADGPVTWKRSDGGTVAGPHYTTNATPGVHGISVRVGSGGDRLALPYHVDDHERFNGTVPAGADPVETATPANAHRHPLTVHDGAFFLRAVLKVTDDTPDLVTGRVNLSIVNATGATVAQGEEKGPYLDVIELPKALPPGDYELVVRGEQDVSIGYELELDVLY